MMLECYQQCACYSSVTGRSNGC